MTIVVIGTAAAVQRAMPALGPLLMTELRPIDSDDKPQGLFEAWMGMTAQEWEELGVIVDDENEPRLL